MPLSYHQQKLLQNLRFRQSSTVASIVVLLYEYIITFRKELRYVWRRPFKLNQAIYLFARYFGITVQSINTYLALGPHSGLSIDERACKRWQLFQALSSYVLSGTLHFILMLMVYALHLKNWKIGIFLSFLYFAQIALQIFVTPQAVLSVEYDPICDAVEIHRDAMFLGISIWVTYLSLVTLTAVKRDLVKLGAPVVKRVIRDGAWTIMFLCSTFTAMLSYSWILQVMQGHIIFGWTNTILSIASCRIIMNMETLNYANSEAETEPAVGFNSFDSLQLVRLEQERREREGLEMESRPCA